MWKGAILVALAVSASAEPFVSGRVTDARGAPVASAGVMVVRLDADFAPVGGAHASLPLDAPLARVVTDESGAFRIDGAAIPPGFHALAFAMPGSAPVLRFRERIAFGAPALPGDLELRAPATATVRGIALDESGAPVAAARVVACSTGEWGASVTHAITDASGRFELAAPQDAVLTLGTMTADRFGIVRAPVGEAKDVTLALHLAPLQLVEGVATALGTGRPVAGLRVRVQAPTWDPHAPLTAEAEALTRPWGRSPVLSESATGDDGSYAVRIPPEGIAFMTSARTVATRCSPGRSSMLDAEPLRGTVLDAGGAPIEGASVRWLELPDVARTDERGRFELLPDVNAAILVTTDDGASRVVATPAAGMRVALPSRSTLRGSVRAGDAPVAGATVRASVAAFDVLTATDAAGAFALALRGATRVTSRAGDVVVTADRGDAPATSPAPPAPRAAERALRVQVVDAAGPVDGAVVRAVPLLDESPLDAPLPTMASGRDGVATLALRGSGPWNVFAMRPGMARALQRGVKADALTLRMERGAILRGVVRGADGRPVGGAAVVAEREDPTPASGAMMMMGPERWAAPTMAGGSFVLRDLPPGTHAVEAVAFGHVSPPRQRVTLAAGAAVVLDLVLGAGATLRGLVHDETGPVSGARVEAAAMRQTFSGRGFGVADVPRITYTMDDGTFAIDGLDPDAWYSVAVSADWHAPAEAGGRPTETVIDVAMRATGAIEGIVLGDATDAYVTCAIASPDGDARPRTRGDASDRVGASVEDGKFSIHAAPGVHACTVEGSFANGSIEGVDVRARMTSQVTVRLRDKPSILVEVVDAQDGRPIVGAQVRAPDSAAETGLDGRARLALPEAASAREHAGEEDERDGIDGEPDEPPAIVARAEGYASAQAPLPVPPPKSMTVKLARLPMIRGRVVDAAGLPAAGAEILRPGHPTDVVADAGGRFELLAPDSAEGGEVITARRSVGAVLEEGSVELPPLAAIQGEIVITLARVETGELTVVVRDASGPVVGARVSLLGEEPIQGPSGAEGRWVATGLRASSYALVVESETGAMGMRRDVEVRAGEKTIENVVLGEGWMVEGTVVDGSRPVEGASIHVSSLGEGLSPQVISHADGSFRAGPISSETDEARLRVRGGDGAATRHVAVRRGGPPVVVNVAAITIDGRVLSGDAPVAGARIGVRCGDRGLAHAETDARGEFVVEDVTASASCALLVARNDGPAHALNITTPAEGAVDLGDVRLQDRMVRGRVVVPEGASTGAVGLDLMSADGQGLGVVSVSPAPDGTFTVRLPAGPLMYVAVPEEDDLAWDSGTLDAEPSLELVFPRPARLEITALGSDGPVGAWARVEARDGVDCSDASVGFGSHGEDGLGPLVIEGLPPGRLVVRVSADGVTKRVEADLAEGESKRLTVTFP